MEQEPWASNTENILHYLVGFNLYMEKNNKKPLKFHLSETLERLHVCLHEMCYFS